MGGDLVEILRITSANIIQVRPDSVHAIVGSMIFVHPALVFRPSIRACKNIFQLAIFSMIKWSEKLKCYHPDQYSTVHGGLATDRKL
jgi:hypothetical protein